MYLLFVISLICFLMAFTSNIAKLAIGLFHREPPELVTLRIRADKIRSDLGRMSMRDDYIKYVQTERSLVQLDKELGELKGAYRSRRTIYEYGVQYGLYAILTLGLIVLSIFYRYTPVVVFGENFNFEPFGRVLNFPTGVPNGISAIFWIGVNNFVARSVAGYVHGRI